MATQTNTDTHSEGDTDTYRDCQAMSFQRTGPSGGVDAVGPIAFGIQAFASAAKHCAKAFGGCAPDRVMGSASSSLLL